MYIEKTKASENNNAIDEELIGLIANKDKQAFDDLISRHIGTLYSVAYRMRFDKHDAEDIVQETMMRVWQRAETWDREAGASVRTWMYAIAHNLCIDFKRRAAKKPHLELVQEPTDKSPSADELVQEKQVEKIVGNSVAQLPDNQRAAIVLCHYQKLSNKEAAEVMNTSVKAVESLLVRAKKALYGNLYQKRSLL